MEKVNLYTVSKNNLYGHRKGSAIGTTEFIMVMAWDYDSVVSKLELIRAYDETKERELFEVYASGHYRLQELPLCFDDGEYFDTDVQYSWESWQACAKSRARSAE